MQPSLYGKDFLKLADFTQQEIAALIDFAITLKADKKAACEQKRLLGKNIALIFEKTSTRTRCAFEVAAYDQGAHVTYLGPGATQIGHKESIKDTARVLSGMFDAIEYRGSSHALVEELAYYASIPVFNGLTDTWHPTQMLADLMTMREYCLKPYQEISYVYIGDGRNNTANSLLYLGALMGMDVRMCAPVALLPNEKIQRLAQQAAVRSGARLTISTDVFQTVHAVDFIYTDVWLSMGEDYTNWQERIELLLPYQVNTELMSLAHHDNVKFMHCLPAYHNRETKIGQEIYQRFALDGLEVTEAVFESPASIVFQQAENRMHSIKALMIACLSTAI